MTPVQCRQARGLLGWTEADLARAADVSVLRVRAFEAGQLAGQRRAIEWMQRALEGAGVRFAASDDTQAGVEFALPPETK